MTRPSEFDCQMLACRASLTAFARKLCRNAERADDLVQQTMLRGLRNHQRFEAGTNMKAWLFTILRNEFYSQMRKRGREVEDVDGIFASRVPCAPAQGDAYDLKIVLGQMEKLNPIQRASLEMIGLDQMSYEEVADLLGLAVGTVKSQVSRARATLLDVYEGRTKALRR